MVCSVGIPCSDPSDEPHPLQTAHQQTKCLEDEHDYDYVDPNTLETSIDNLLQENDSLYYASKVVAPPASRQEGKMELVVGSDGVVQQKKKPVVPPKPTKKQLRTNSSNDHSSTADWR